MAPSIKKQILCLEATAYFNYKWTEVRFKWETATGTGKFTGATGTQRVAAQQWLIQRPSLALIGAVTAHPVVRRLRSSKPGF